MKGCIIFLIAGILCGRFFLCDDAAALVKQSYGILLYVLLICVGISVGANSGAYGLKMPKVTYLLLPLLTVGATLSGGLLCGFLLGYKPMLSLCVASGLSFSSVSGVLVGDAFGAQAGAIAFFSNLLRELLCFIIVPLTAKKAGGMAAVSLCASTAGDTLLPLLSKQQGVDSLAAVYNGVVCTALAPALIRLFIFLS